MKSDVMTKLGISNHQKKIEELKDKLEKKSPRKVRMLRSFFKRRHLELDKTLVPSYIKSAV
jgi:hypothetical protein